ncbi:2110_t:CDS:2 [Funneliformis caledonium]|uniref:2110_t:CDS:1 n=1 Tax=Funneliformis caledonium TaxID=1117310 RepID=A0A9N9CPR9_9GLOM|nr:2110_t:CDS:2 [Funneliformis caledonium]
MIIADTVFFIDTAISISAVTPTRVNSFIVTKISLWTDLRRLGSDLRLKLFQHKSEGCYLEVPGNNNPRIEPPSTILETEEQRNQRNHEEELEKARKEKRPKIYNEGRPGNKKPRIDPPSTILEIEEQRNHEELAKKYIFKDSLELKNTKKKSPLLYVMTLRGMCMHVASLVHSVMAELETFNMPGTVIVNLPNNLSLNLKLPKRIDEESIFQAYLVPRFKEL